MKQILWADDEIELLKPHIIYLEQKGYHVTPVVNGLDAIAMVKEQFFDAILLDEMMPGLDGLSTLLQIKNFDPSLKVIMVTKSEEEEIMEDAIGQKIDDYLIKPVSPSQVYTSLKKNIEQRDLSSKKMSKNYINELNKINNDLANGYSDFKEFTNLHIKLSRYQTQLANIEDSSIKDMLSDVKKTANAEFCKLIIQNYENWMKAGASNRPLCSVDLLKQKVIAPLKTGRRCILFVFDCLRYDHFIILEQLLQEYFKVEHEPYLAILPSATAYSRNAIFSGLFPDEFERIVPQFWKDADVEDGLNNHEDIFLSHYLKRNGFTDNFQYIKCVNRQDYVQLERQANNILQNKLTAIVVNFIDVVTHGRMESKLVQEIIPNDFAYAEIVRNWFLSSPLVSLFKQLATEDVDIFITTDHGAIQCHRDVKIAADKETSNNLRFKFGRSLDINKKFGVQIKDPTRYRLPKLNVVNDYVIAKEDYYLVYPSNYNRYAQQFKDSYQHGGISMEELIIPFAKLSKK